MSESRNGAEYVAASNLAEFGLTTQDVRRRCQWAVEYTGLDGNPCWLRTDLEPLLGDEGGESR